MDESVESSKKFTTQRVDVETSDLIKDLTLALSRRGIRLRQSDVIHLVFEFIKGRQQEFLDFTVSGELSKSSGGGSGVFDAIFDTVSRPWFPYGKLS